MAALANAKHERFAQGLAKGLPAVKAYEEAGYKPDTGSASRLSANASVKARVASILASLAKIEERATELIAVKLAVTREWVIDRLQENVQRAMQATQAIGPDGRPGEFKYEGSVANRALELLGKEIGMFVERREVTVRRVEEMSLAELTDELARLEEGADQGSHQTTH